MLTLGSHKAGRVRVGCVGTSCVARRARRGLLPTYLPQKIRLILEAKRGGRATAGADSGDDEASSSLPSGPARGAADSAASLQYWEEQVALMAFKEMQAALRSRGLNAGGRKDEVIRRLADALLYEHTSGGAATAGPGDAQPQGEEEEEAEEGERVEAVLDRLDELSYQELKQMCNERGLSPSGKKADLQLRLAEAMVRSEEDVEALQGEEEETSPAPPAPPGDPEALLPELLSLTSSELTASLREYGAPTRGTKAELARRLAEIMVAEVAEELGQSGADAGEEGEDEYDEEEYMEAEEVRVAAAPAAPSAPRAPSGPRFDPAAMSPADRRLLLAVESRALRAENEGKTRQKLFAALKQLRQSPSYQSRSVLLDQLVRAMAEQRVEAAVQAALADPAAAVQLGRRLEELRRFPDGSGGAQAGGGLGSVGAIDYSRLTGADVRRMRVEDLRAALTFFGMDSEGNKYEMLERLMARVQSTESPKIRGRPPAAGAAGSPPPSAPAPSFDHVLGMTLRTLREELDARGLPTSGGRNELQTRLITALRQELEASRNVSPELKAAAEGSGEDGAAEDVEGLGGGDALSAHLAALSQLPLERRAAAVVTALTRHPESLITLGAEAPVDVAVVAGCPPGRLDLAQQSLDAARSLLDHLYTAHMTSPADKIIRPKAEAEAGGEGEGDEAAATAAAEEEEEEEDATMSSAPVVGAVPRAPLGSVVSVWWLDGATGESTLLSPAQVYGATAAELAAGCLPAVHRGLLAVPPPSPLSLDRPELDEQVPATAAGGGGPSSFPDVSSLAAHLRLSSHLVFPAVAAGGPLYCSLQRALEAAGVAHVGSGAEAAELAQDRVAVLRRLESLSYPVVPQLELSAADVAAAVREAVAACPEQDEQDGGHAAAAAEVLLAAQTAVLDKVAAWCQQQGFHPERQLFVVRPRHNAGAANSADAATALGAARVAELLGGPMAEAVLEAGEDAELQALSSALVLEPVPPGSAARFLCTVVETPDGPVALLPSEVELYDTEMEVLRHMADVAEWNAMREGQDEQEITETRASVLTVEAEPWRAVYDPRVTLPATTTARLHTPPRLSRKLTHAVRHAAARLFSELGLRDVAAVEGWVELPAGYAEALEASAKGPEDEQDAVPLLYDTDPYILARVAEKEAERIAADPAPLEAYYDCGSSWHADLSLFDPATRLSGDLNGEGATVRFSAVAADLPLDGRHPAVLQAAELGLPHAALLRNLANSALRRAAAAGDRRALLPSEPYTSPDVVLEAAAVSAALSAEEGADSEEAGVQAAQAMAAAARPVEVGPQPLQLPMPPQLPLYHTAVMQHLREADAYDTWVESHDPDYWDDAEGPVRVSVMSEAMEDTLEEESGLPRGAGSCPNPVAADMVSAVALAGHGMALDAAVEALGDFGSALSAVMSSMTLDEALQTDAEIPLTRTRDLPQPDEQLQDGTDGTAEDPRVVAAWQMAAICELARRHGWEVLEAADAAEEAADAAAKRQAEGLPDPTSEEEAAAAAAAEEEQMVLEAMCDNDDEVMELRTGLVTPVQLYLRFRARQSRRGPNSHPLLVAGSTLSYDDYVAGEQRSDTEVGLGKKQAAAEGEDADEVDNADAEMILAEEGEEADTPGPFGPASTGPGAASPSAYNFIVPPDDAVELPVFVSAGLMASGLAVAAAAESRGGGLAAEVGAAVSQRLDAGELEALALLELGFSAEPVDVDETGQPVLAAIGPSTDGLHRELVLGGFASMAELPTFHPLAAVMADEGLEPTTSADDDEGTAARTRMPRSRGGVSAASGRSDDDDDDRALGFDWEEEDAFGRGVARAEAAGWGAGGDDGDEEAAQHPATPLVEAALEAGDVEAAELAALVPPMGPTRVWVVVGGDGHWGREVGLAAGANVMAKLSKYQDLVVEPFLMVPMGEGRDQQARRTELLRRRTEYIAGIGMNPELDLPDSMSLEALRAMPPMPTGRPETQCIYAVSMATVARTSVGEALSSLERTMAREGTALHSLSEMQRQQRAAHRDVQAELAAAGMEGVASLWDGDVTGQPGPPAPRPLDLATFAEDAARAGAVVLVAARGEMAECGNLQALMELNGVPYVGPGSQQMSLLWDKAGAQELLQDLSDQGIDAPPRFLLPYDQALTAAELDEEEAEQLMDRLRVSVLGEEAAQQRPSLLVRPAADAAGCGVARLQWGSDLVAYMTALREGDSCLPADALSCPHPAINLPPLPPPALAFEPFVESDPLLLVLAQGGAAEGEEDQPEPGKTAGRAAGKRGAKKDAQAEVSEPSGNFVATLQCGRESGWVDVSFALMGPLGGMSCLPPAMRAVVVSEADVRAAAEADSEQAARLTAAAESGDEEALAGVAQPVMAATLLAHSPRTLVVPPPEEALAAEALDAACQRAVRLADRLGLRGLVQIEAFVASDSGDLVVYDINANPDLGGDSPIYRQAAAAGLLPHDLLRELLGLALMARASPEGQVATFDSKLTALEHAEWALEEDDEEALGLGLAEDDEVESEGGRGGLEEEEDDMLGQLEEMRVGAGAAEEEDDEEEGGRPGGARDRLAGLGAEGGLGGGDDEEGSLYFDDDEEGGGAAAGGRAAGGIGGGYMGLSEFGAGGRSSRSGGTAGRGAGGFEDDGDADFN